MSGQYSETNLLGPTQDGECSWFFEFPDGLLRAQRAECGTEGGLGELESSGKGKLFLCLCVYFFLFVVEIEKNR